MGSSDSKFKICFKNNNKDVECNVNGSLDISSSNKYNLTCVVDGILYKSVIAFLGNTIYLFNKVGSIVITIGVITG